MSERPRADLIEKIRNLLKKTEAVGCTRAEAEGAFSLASRLMAEHNLAMADIEAGGDDGGDEIDWFEDQAFESARWTLENNLAYFIVKEFCFVEGYINRRYEGGRQAATRLFLFGKAQNVESARWMFAALLDAFDRLFDDYRRVSRCQRSDRRMFVTGVSQGFAEKMREERKAMEIVRDLERGSQGKQGTAIVLASVREKTAVAFREAHKDLGKARSNFAGVTGTQSSLQAGYQAGKSLDLNRAVGGPEGQGGAKGLPGR